MLGIGLLTGLDEQAKGERRESNTSWVHINGAGAANTASKIGKSIFTGELNWTVPAFTKKMYHKGPLNGMCFNHPMCLVTDR